VDIDGVWAASEDGIAGLAAVSSSGNRGVGLMNLNNESEKFLLRNWLRPSIQTKTSKEDREGTVAGGGMIRGAERGCQRNVLEEGWS
jgi:hypothetical protein